MANMKKILGIVLALAMVFSVATCAFSASAASIFPKTGIELNLKDAFENTANKLKSLISGKKDETPTEDTTATDAVKTAADKATSVIDGIKDRDPIFDFNVDYDVEVNWHAHVSFGKVPTTTTTEAPTVPEITEAPTEAATEEQKVDLDDESPLASVTDATPLADVEQVANTGDAGVAAIVALSAVSAAAFVVAKKK